MNTTRLIDPTPSLPLTVARQLDDACARFEAAWQSDTRPDLAEFLTAVPEAARTPLLLELIRLDAHYRRQVGDTPTVGEYLHRFPELESDRVAAAAETVSDKESSTPPAGGGWVAVGHHILGELGHGGMGVVYKARHVGLNRLVALKMIRSAEFASPVEVARFRLEAEALARLQHPNIVPIFEVGECAPPGGSGQVPYLSLEFVSGGTLAARFDRTPQPARVAAEVLEAITRGVQHAHENGIVHRDLKPANVLLTPGGTPKVTDFGLAKLLDADDHTHTGAVLGTPAYMAPEQADGRTRDIGPATDVYALGGILYEALTGNPPFRGENAPSTLEMVRNQAPVPPSRLLPSIPRDLEVIALKCLEKESAKRYPTAAALADDLRRYLDGHPIQARPVGAVERGWRWCRRNPALALAGGLAAAAVLAVAVVSTVFAFMQTQANRDLLAEQGRVLAEQQKVTDALAVARAQQLIGAETAYGQGLNFCERDEVTRGLLWLARAAELAPEDATDLHARVRRAIGDWTPQHPRLRAILDHADPVRVVEYHPSGKWVATSAGDVVQLWDADVKSPNVGKPVGPPMKHSALVERIAFSPDGMRLATVTSKGHMRLWQTDPTAAQDAGQPLTDTVADEVRGVEYCGWGPDNQTLVVTSRSPCRLTFWQHQRTQPGKPLVKLKSHTTEDGNMLVSRGHAMCPLFLLETMDPDNSLRVQCFSFKTAAPVGPVLQAKGDGGGWYALSPNGRFVLIAQEAGVDVYQIDPEADPVIRKRVQLPQANTSRGVFDATDARAAILGQDGLLRVWNLNDDDPQFGKPLADPLPVGERVYFIDAESERELLTLSEHEMRSELAVWDVYAQVDIRTLSRTAIPYGKWTQPTKFHTMKRWFIPGLNRGVIWDARTRHVVGLPVPFADNAEHFVAIAPDDSTIAPWAVYQSSRVCLWSLAPSAGEVAIPAEGGNYAVTHDGSRVATLHPHPIAEGPPKASTVRLHDGGSGKLLHEWLVGCGDGIAFSPDGTRLVVGGVACEVWDVSGGQPMQLARLTPDGVPDLHFQVTGGAAFRPDGRRYLLHAQRGQEVIRYMVNIDPKSDEVGRRVELPRAPGSSTVGILRPFSSDSRSYLTSHPDTGEPWIADADTNQFVAAVEMPQREVSYSHVIGFAAHEPSIVGVVQTQGELDSQVQVFRRWDARTGRVLETLDAGPRGRVIGQFSLPTINACLLDRAIERGRFDAKEIGETITTALTDAVEFEGDVGDFPSRSLLSTLHNAILTGHSNGYQLREWGSLRRVGLPIPGAEGGIRFTTGRAYWQLGKDKVGRQVRQVLYRQLLPEPASGSPVELRRQVERRTGFKLGDRGELLPLASTDW